MAGRGSSPGERRGGRGKGAKNKTTQRKEQLLASAAEQFRAADYDPLREMRCLVIKKRLAKNDVLRFNMHQVLARKYFPDVSAVKVSGDADAPLQLLLTVVQYETWLEQQPVTQEPSGAQNGHYHPAV